MNTTEAFRWYLNGWYDTKLNQKSNPPTDMIEYYNQGARDCAVRLAKGGFKDKSKND